LSPCVTARPWMHIASPCFLCLLLFFQHSLAARDTCLHMCKTLHVMYLALCLLFHQGRTTFFGTNVNPLTCIWPKLATDAWGIDEAGIGLYK
jgi:hypothetical protein